jgi:protein TonB
VKSRARSIRSWIIGGSVAFHAALGTAAVLIPKPERGETAAIELADIKKKKEVPKPPPPPPPPPPQEKPKPPPPPPRAQASQAKVAAESTKAEALPPMPMSDDGFADLGGVALGNGGGGGDGVAIPTAGGPRVAAAGAGAGAAPKTVTKKAVQQLAAAGPDVCTQAVVRPKRTVGVQGKYTQQAKQAEIEGLVKVEVTVDESGKVIAARIVSGLGYGLDEAALEAAKKCVYEPATLCGRPVVATAMVVQRFELE